MNAPFFHEFSFTEAETQYSEVFDFDQQSQVRGIQATLDCSEMSGTTPTLDVTPQFSYGDGVWYDETAFAQITSDPDNETLRPTNFGTKMRFKAVFAGTVSPTATAKVKVMTK